ncbi:hypothetical protein [Legionella maceachernii]|uniref:Coiled-coil protein n=1 Tax=Legionella maceachernii TaxID=466 RepID=A0A0W0W0V7_9GAMM|nr:hypothetical protein [Legionella maceachernii]KTD25869.1 coiled-coil protein [Legionella maceachernii]SJZ47363.1 hypothetical protein SAMN02745128_00147 [Legionella maceachernii]SUP03920.1 Uncharacterised protein [Legionella maceachernii]
MDPQVKKRLIAFYLKHKFGEAYKDSWLENTNYALLAEAIERIDDWGPDFLKLTEIEPTKPYFSVFTAILDEALQFSNTIPPACTNYDEQKLDQRMDLEEKMRDELRVLPNTDYTPRVARYLTEEMDEEFDHLKQDAIKKLILIVQQKMPHLKLVTYKDLRIAIENHEQLLRKAKDDLTQQQLTAELNLLHDLNKIARLRIIDIPKQDGTPALFCTLSEQAGGVTEKLSLLSFAEVKQKLKNIQQAGNMDFSEYNANRNDFKLSTQAILKLPKHGKATEVQREAIALNLSRLLGFTTTNSNMVEFEGKAALFVPFDRIQLLSEFARGEEQKVIVPSGLSWGSIKKIGDKYYHYASIIPVGSELNRDQFLEDFGKLEAFSYLCNDPDFIGMLAGQNKGIKEGKSLYVFDQVTMDKDKLAIDTRFSLIPVGISRHSRHNQGRNRMLIDDSSFAAKVDSFVHLFQNQHKINLMLDEIIATHQTKLKKLEKSITDLKQKGGKKSPELEQLEAQFTQLKTLEVDALKIKTAINRRIGDTFKNFPELNGSAMSPELFLTHHNLIKQSFLLEKLVNNPVLFTDDGRPYRNPWTYRNTNNIVALREHAGTVSLTFANFDAEQLVSIFRKNGVNLSTCHQSGNTLHIPMTELAKITELSLFPALRDFNPHEEYVNIEDLRRIAKSYPEGLQEHAIAIIERYQFEIVKIQDPIEKAHAMKYALDAIHHFCHQVSNKGFLKHVELNLQMDIQKQLRELLHLVHGDNGLDAKIAEAFDAAVKLDRINDLNQVLLAFAKNPEANKKTITDYLNQCITHGLKATDYNLGKLESSQMHRESLMLLEIINKKSMESSAKMIDLMGGSTVEADHKEVDLEFDEALDETEQLEIQALQELAQSTSATLEEETDKTVKDKTQEGIIVSTKL